MGGGSLIPVLYGGCFLFLLAVFGVGAALYYYGRRKERAENAQIRVRKLEHPTSEDT